MLEAKKGGRRGGKGVEGVHAKAKAYKPTYRSRPAAPSPARPPSRDQCRPAATNAAPPRTAPTTARHCRGGRCNSLLRARRTSAAVEWNTATPVERMGIDVVGRATGARQPQARPRHRERRRVAQGRAFARALQSGTALQGPAGPLRQGGLILEGGLVDRTMVPAVLRANMVT